MIRALLLALLVAACGSSPPAQAMCTVNTVSQNCVDAANASDFTFIKAKIFDANCFGSACHEATGTAKLHFSKDVAQADAYANLMGSDGMGYVSTIDPTRRVIVPGDPAASYMEMMIQRIAPKDAVPPASAPPSNIGYMPQAGMVLCCQKLDAIDRWIAAGAPND
jgi:hypothetical protein